MGSPLAENRSPSLISSVIVTSFNQVRSLQLLLCSLDRQTVRDFEVIVADDGSSDGTLELCSQARTFPLTIVTQPDQGYRKSRILNQAVLKSKADYLIFADGDVILEKHFIQDHLMLKKPDHFICGRRVDLGPLVSKRITAHDVNRGCFDRLSWGMIFRSLRGDVDRIKRAFRIVNPTIRRALGYLKPIDLLGSNFSLWKKDLESVNGFNEELESYWGEDGDLYIRLRNSGRVPVGAKSLCVQYHVYHDRRTPDLNTVNRYQELLNNSDYKWAEKGLRGISP